MDVIISRKDYLKKRWLFVVSLIFTYIIPFEIVLEAMFVIKKVDRKVSVQMAGFIVGIIYIAFLSKRLKKYIENLQFGSFKIFLEGISQLIPFTVVALLVFLVDNILSGFDKTIIFIIVSMAIGTILRVIEFVKNKDFLYDLEIFKEAKRKIDIENKLEVLRNAKQNNNIL